MPSADRFWKTKSKGRVIEVPISHALDATETHLRALTIINDDEDVTLEFTPTMVRINLTKPKGGTAKTKDG